LKSRSGFTLVEILVAIGIIALLLAISIPVLMRARASGGQTKSMSNARSLTLLIEEHIQRHRGAYPFPELQPATFERPSMYRFLCSPSDGPFLSAPAPDGVFRAADKWPGILTNGAPYADEGDVYFSPGLPPGSGRATSYHYSNSFVARPELWRPESTQNEDMIQPVRAQEVAHPSKKALLWDAQLAYIPDGAKAERFGSLPGDPLPIAFADGHAAVHFAREAQAPVPNRFRSPWRDAPLHNTPEGVLGWDY